MSNTTSITTVGTAPTSRAYGTTARCARTTELFGATNPMVTGTPKPHHRRPKEASPPT